MTQVDSIMHILGCSYGIAVQVERIKGTGDSRNIRAIANDLVHYNKQLCYPQFYF